MTCTASGPHSTQHHTNRLACTCFLAPLSLIPLHPAANLLKPALARGDLHCIGATTVDEYRKHIEQDGAFARRFQVPACVAVHGVLLPDCMCACMVGLEWHVLGGWDGYG